MKGLLTSELAQAAARGTPHEYPKGWQFRFDARLSQRAAAGELLAWLLLFDGVFKAQLSVVPTIPEPSAVRTNDNSGYEDSVADLLFPSGNIVVACLGRAGDESIRPAIRVEPGRYRVRVQQNPCEDEHWFLERFSDYPSADGPDWTITLARLPA